MGTAPAAAAVLVEQSRVAEQTLTGLEELLRTIDDGDLHRADPGAGGPAQRSSATSPWPGCSGSATCSGWWPTWTWRLSTARRSGTTRSERFRPRPLRRQTRWQRCAAR